ncbi:MAG: lytic transglycosylase domain-containing protein [Armatimonadetes bacterium]|nr:lytic transglycosylase domain-containing protein [Armatimonadota bacterium]
MRFLTFLFLVLLCAPAGAAPWYFPPHVGKEFVNPHLTPERAMRGGVPADWDQQLVLWRGVVQSQSTLLPQQTGAQGTPGRPEPTPENTGRVEIYMTLRTPAGPVQIHFPGRVLTLDNDRTGYTVAVKGSVQVQNGRVVGLKGRSVILLSPPATYAGKEGVTNFLAWWVGFHNPGYKPALRERVAEAIVREARKNSLDPLFLASLIQIESAFHVDARSRSGAIGLGQLMPFTAAGLGVNAHDPDDNVKGCARMISGLVRDWIGRDNRNPLALAVAGYNAGPNLVKRLGAVPRIPETNNYVYFIGFVHTQMTDAATRAGVVHAAVKD